MGNKLGITSKPSVKESALRGGVGRQKPLSRENALAASGFFQVAHSHWLTIGAANAIVSAASKIPDTKAWNPR
jgi:hypothetical protein